VVSSLNKFRRQICKDVLCYALKRRHEVLKQHFKENKNALNIVVGKLNLNYD